MKVSLLRDNLTRQPIESWPEVIGRCNPSLAASIQQLRPKTRLHLLMYGLLRRLSGSEHTASRAEMTPTSRR